MNDRSGSKPDGTSTPTLNIDYVKWLASTLSDNGALAFTVVLGEYVLSGQKDADGKMQVGVYRMEGFNAKGQENAAALLHGATGRPVVG